MSKFLSHERVEIKKGYEKNVPHNNGLTIDVLHALTTVFLRQQNTIFLIIMIMIIIIIIIIIIIKYSIFVPRMHSFDNYFYKSTKIVLYYVDACFYKKKG